HAETARVQVSTVHDVIGARWIAPKFIRQVEHVGEEVRHVNEGFTAAEQYACGVLPLRHRIVPMLYPPPFVPEDRVGIIRYVSRRQDIGIVRLQELVDHDAVIDLETGAARQIRDGLYSDARHQQVETGRFAVRQLGCRALFDRRNTALGDDTD